MLAALGSLLMVVTTLVPLIYTVVRVAPMLGRFFRYLFVWFRGGAVLGRNPMWGVIVGAFVFIGGFSFFISIYFGWGFELYIKFFDLVFSPFTYVAENLLASFIRQLPNLPANTASVLCLFDFGSCFTFFMMGFSFEVYMRILIYFLVRRGK